MKVLIGAGGTGGGIYPALAASSELRQLGLKDEQLSWIGAKGEMEEILVPRAGLHLDSISGGAIVGVPLYVKMMNTIKLAWSVGKTIHLMRRFKPDVVFMTGGFVAVPVTLAAWLLRLPIAIYLPDVEPGAALKLGIRFARKVACTTAGSEAYVPASKMVVTGYPVRPELRAATQMSQVDALAQFGLEPGRPTLLVFGGSRGARSINQALTSCLPQLLAEVQVIHISGTLSWSEVSAAAKRLPTALRSFYRPFAYLHEEMGAAFRAANLVVARAGASMLGESPAFGLPAVLVPYPHAWRYQDVNASYLTERGAATCLADNRLGEALLPTVLALLRDEAKLARMRAAALALDIPDAATNLAQLILTVGQSVGQGIGA
jgi:UDP-N-acetylglucosamine--N-acetylmuramyl-(pentapeptide) pyrophosphoryl-undecaprenol N-acetylglucosamine transferase